MKVANFEIKGRLDSLNEYTNACRMNAYAGADLKRKNETIVRQYIRQAKLKPIKDYPIQLHIVWVEKDSRRDVDNITFAVKFILDALVKENILIDDSQKYVNKIDNVVMVDKEEPRIAVYINKEDI